jgi:hypothetical protein
MRKREKERENVGRVQGTGSLTNKLYNFRPNFLITFVLFSANKMRKSLAY